MKYSLSVIIVNYNTDKLLSKCVASIKRDPRVEIIVVDNASTDDSLDGIKNVTIIRNKENMGFAKAVNQGIEVAHGKYILLLNPDTKVKPGAIEKMLEFANGHEDAGVVGPQLLNPDGSVQSSVFYFPTVWRAIAEFWFGVKKAYSKYVPKGKDAGQVDIVVGAAFLITPIALQKVGLFDERYFMYFEDFDYCLRVFEKGLKVYYLPTAEIIHYHGVSGKSQQGVQLQRLVESSKIYHGLVSYYIIDFILWSGQKWLKRLF